MWIALDNGPIRFFSLEKDNENNETLHDTLWQHNSLHTCRKVPGCLFPDVEEYCGDFEAEWNWRGDEADYVVHVNFTRDTTFSAVVGSASDTHVEYTGYRFINGRSQEWCKLYVLCTQVMDIPLPGDHNLPTRIVQGQDLDWTVVEYSPVEYYIPPSRRNMLVDPRRYVIVSLPPPPQTPLGADGSLAENHDNLALALCDGSVAESHDNLAPAPSDECDSDDEYEWIEWI